MAVYPFGAGPTRPTGPELWGRIGGGTGVDEGSGREDKVSRSRRWSRSRSRSRSQSQEVEVGTGLRPGLVRISRALKS
jgi:hypothetical protein